MTISGQRARRTSNVHQGRNTSSGFDLKRIFAGLYMLGCMVTAAASAAAQPADSMLGLIIGEQWSELDLIAHERLAADPLDGIGLHALARKSVDGDVGSDEQRMALLPKIEACLAARPNDGLCHLAYGQVLGAQLKSLTMFDALGSVSKVPESFEAAVAADPSSFDARESAVTFYIRAPSIVGGSLRKAYRHVDQYAKINPDYAGLLYVLIALEEKDLPKAKALLTKLPAESSDPVLDQMIAKRWLALGLAYLDAGDYASARAALAHGVAHGAPSVAGQSHWGLGRIAQAQGHPEEAIDEYRAFLAFDPNASGKPAEEARASLRQLGTN